MSEAVSNNTNGTTTVATPVPVSTPATPPSAGQNGPKVKLRDRINARTCQFEVKHPVLAGAVRWVGRGIVGAGLFLLGRKTAKPQQIVVTLPAVEPEEEVNEPQGEEDTETEE